MRMLRYLTWLLRAFLFLVLLAFALKNTAPVRLQFFFDTGWDAPLVVVLLVFFAAGAVLGVIACLGPMVRQRRAIGSLKRSLEERANGPAVPLPPLPPDPGI